MEKSRAYLSKVLSKLKSSRPKPILDDYTDPLFKKQPNIDESNNSSPCELPPYMMGIYNQHIIMENNLRDLYTVLRKGRDLDVRFDPIDDRPPVYRRHEYISLLEEWDIKKTFLFLLCGYSSKLCKLDRPEDSLEWSYNVFKEASVKDIIFQYRNVDSRYCSNLELSVFLMEFDSENKFYVFLHKSMFGSKGTSLNIIISDRFTCFYESIYFYTKNSLAQHIDSTKQLYRDFFFKSYNLYKDRKSEHSVKVPKIVYFKED